MSGSQNNTNIEIITVISNTSSNADCSQLEQKLSQPRPSQRKILEVKRALL